jgi:molecular chaperone HtpG
MEKINKAQAFQNNEKAPGYMMAKKSLEINPSHPVMKKMLEKIKDSEDSSLDEASTEYADLLYQMALLQSGFSIEQPSVLSEPLQRLVNVGFGL